jgi:hypothetical protein
VIEHVERRRKDCTMGGFEVPNWVDIVYELGKGGYESREAEENAHKANEKHDPIEEAKEMLKGVTAKMGVAGAIVGGIGALAAPAAEGAALAGLGAGAASFAGLPAAAAVGLGLGQEMDKAWKVSDNMAGVHKEDLDQHYEEKFGFVNQDQRGARGIANAERKLKDHDPMAYWLMKEDHQMQVLRNQANEREAQKQANIAAARAAGNQVQVPDPLDYAAPFAH